MVALPVLSGIGLSSGNDAHADSAAPVISDVQAIPSVNGATVTWMTDQPSNSIVLYGQSLPYMSANALDTGNVTSHSEILSGLSPDTAYHYAVISTDASGPSVSPDATFTTLVSNSVTGTVGSSTPGYLSLNTYSGMPGSTVVAMGSDFLANEPVTLNFDGTTMPLSADINGDFTATTTVPNVASGNISISATGPTSGEIATNSFYVEPVATSTSGLVTLSSYSGSPGSDVTVSGSGFMPGEIVTMNFGPTIATATADSNGDVSMTFTVPSLASGDIGVVATGGTSGVSASTAYFVEPPNAPPTTTSTTTGTNATMDLIGPVRAGTTVDFGGRNFAPGEHVQVTANGNPVTTALADGGGNFTTGSLPVPNTPNTTETYTFTGMNSGVSRTVTLTITP
jgi:hypothetical protein